MAALFQSSSMSKGKPMACANPRGTSCDGGQRCVPPGQMCNRKADCDDGSDEYPGICSELYGYTEYIIVWLHRVADSDEIVNNRGFY